MGLTLPQLDKDKIPALKKVRARIAEIKSNIDFVKTELKSITLVDNQSNFPSGIFFLTQGETIEPCLPSGSQNNRVVWVRTSGNSIPPNAIKAGRERNGEVLYPAKFFHEDGVHAGKTSKL